MAQRPLAVVSAMQAELSGLAATMTHRQSVRRGQRDFHLGELAGRPVVLVLSGIGKVAAAITASLLLDRFDVRSLLFTGVAGGLDPAVQVGDVVVASEVLQHDMDASPLFPRYEIPLTGRSRFACDASMNAVLSTASASALAGLAGRLAAFGVHAPQVRQGLIVSGDQFVSGAAESAALRVALPEALAVEMEGAAVGQVCSDFGVPFAVLRSISDRADDQAHVDFTRYVDEIASVCMREVVMHAATRL